MTILIYILGIGGACFACIGAYTLFTGNTTINILGGAAIPDSISLTLTMQKQYALPCVIVGVIMFLIATSLMRNGRK